MPSVLGGWHPRPGKEGTYGTLRQKAHRFASVGFWFMKLHEAIKEFVELKKVKGPRSRKTAARYEMTLRIFCLCMQDPLLEDIELSHILWYLKELERLGWKPNGINLICIALRRFFEYCHLRGYSVMVNENLIPLVERTFSIPRITDIETFKKLLQQIPADTNHPHHIRNRTILLMLWDTGVRVGELMSINTADLNLKQRTALIKTEKSRGRRPVRQIFWTEETNKHLIKWIEKAKKLRKLFTFADDEALFVSIGKSPKQNLRGCRLNVRGVAEVMRVLSNRAGLPTVANAHSIRHSMGRDTIKALRSNSAVSNILGHSNLESSYVYTMLFGDDLKEQWQEVMKKRGHPLADAPKRASGFPRMKHESDAIVPGQMRGTEIKSPLGGRWVRT